MLITIPSTVMKILNDKSYLEVIEKSGIKTQTIKEILCCAEAFMGVEADIVSAAGELAMIQSFLENSALQPTKGDTFQTLSDRLADRFKELGGELVLNQKVNEVVFKNKKAIGVRIEKDFVQADSVVLAVAQDAIKPLIQSGTHIPAIKKRIKQINNLPPPNSDYYSFYLISKKAVEERPDLINTAYHIYKLPENNTIDNWKLPIWVPNELINNKYYVMTLIVTEKDQEKVDYWMNLRKTDYQKYKEEKEKMADIFLKELQRVEPIFAKYPPLKHLMTMSPASYMPYGSKYPIAGLPGFASNFR